MKPPYLPSVGRIIIMILCLLVVFPAFTGAAPLTPDQRNILDKGIFYFDNEVNECAAASSASDSGSGSTAGSWNSGLQPPYILEQFAIETLKDVAAKKGVDAANAVTEEHTIALVAFMYGEGGDIMNNDLFNPLNTGINAPDLLATSNNGSGLQSFKSFDAGVEATARTMMLPTQSRLADVLTQKDSDATKFMQTLTYYSQYGPTQQFWAEASLPPNTDSYFQGRLSLVDQVRSNYANTAGTILGTPEKEQLLGLRDPSKLQFSPAGSAPASATGAAVGGTCASAATSAGIVSNNIAQTAINLAWPDGRKTLTPTGSYATALNTFNPIGKSSFNGADCGAFIATVMHSTGADKDFPPLGTSTMLNYVNSKPDKYDVLPSITDTSALLPGDILIKDGHTYIFVGKQASGFDSAGASLGDFMPTMEHVYLEGGAYARVRLK